MAVDRDYYGSEYDGFQDIFTVSVYTNLELGRFEPCKAILDNYLTESTDAKGMINMRGPETAQFGLTLSLIARYLNYTHDTALIQKHHGKIEATAAGLIAMHDSSLRPGQEHLIGQATPEKLPYYALSLPVASAAVGMPELNTSTITFAWPKLLSRCPPAR